MNLTYKHEKIRSKKLTSKYSIHNIRTDIYFLDVIWMVPSGFEIEFFFRIFSFRNVQFFVRIKNNLDAFFINIFIFKISKLDFNSIMAESNFAVAKHTHRYTKCKNVHFRSCDWISTILSFIPLSLSLSLSFYVFVSIIFFIRFFSQTDFLWIHKHEHESNFEWK